MPTYVPTAWVNNTPPSLSAVNLNKLVNELRAQAAAAGVSHSLPTWVDSSSPALTEGNPWNEMERVAASVAAKYGLSYTPTAWGDGWAPARNAANLAKLENAAVANRNAIDANVSGAYVEPYPATMALRQPVPSGVQYHADTGLMISKANYWLLDGVTLGTTDMTPYRTWFGCRPHGYYGKMTPAQMRLVSMYRNYVDGVGYACGSSAIQFPVPTWLDVELGQANANMQSSDAQIYVADATSGDIYQTYRTTAPGKASRDISCSSTRWNSVRVDTPDAGWYGGVLKGAESATNTLAYGCTAPFGPSASQIALGAAMVRPHDFDDMTPGSFMRHALRLNQPCGSDGSHHPRFVAPAKSGDGQRAYGIPYGARIQLDPTIDVTTWPSLLAIGQPARGAIMKIARTAQVYGAVCVDYTGAGHIESVDSLGAANSPDSPSVGYTFPWQQMGWPTYGGVFPSGWGMQNGLPYDLMDKFKVVDWGVWTGA